MKHLPPKGGALFMYCEHERCKMETLHFIAVVAYKTHSIKFKAHCLTCYMASMDEANLQKAGLPIVLKGYYELTFEWDYDKWKKFLEFSDPKRNE